MAHATTQADTTLAQAIRENAAVLTAAMVRARRGVPRGVHRARVATRRLREALARAERQGLDAAADRRALRRLGRALGPVREMDVVRLVLAQSAGRFGWPTVAVARVDAHCARRRDTGRRNLDEVLERLDLPAVIGRLREVVDTIDRLPRDAAADTAQEARVRERARDLARAIRGAGTVYAAGPLHEIRIAAKKLRYALELDGSTGAGAMTPDAVGQLKRLQTLLGRIHDVQTVQHQLHEVASASADRRVTRALTVMDRDLETLCRGWHGRVLGALPRVRATVAVLLEATAPERAAATRIRPARMRADRVLPRASGQS